MTGLENFNILMRPKNVCLCKGVPESVIKDAIINRGADTIEKIREITTANTGCGTCTPSIEGLLKKYS